MRSLSQQQPFALGLGTVGALAVLVAATIHAYGLSQQRRRRPPLSRAEWAEAVLEIGAIRGFEQIADEIAERSLDPSIRADVWPFLLEVFEPASTYAQRQQQHALMVRQYQQLLLQCQAYEAALKESLRPASPGLAAGGPAAAGCGPEQQQQPKMAPPLAQQQQQQQVPQTLRQFGEAHRIIVIDAVRTDFTRHAAALSLPDGGGGSSGGSSSACSGGGYAAGVAAFASLLSGGLAGLQQSWLGSLLGGQAASWGHGQALWVSDAAARVLDACDHMSSEARRQAARMIGLLSAYALHDPDTGYAQGMSDLLLPLLLLLEDDALAFWCFVALMQRQGLRSNFAADESGIFGRLRGLGCLLQGADRPLSFRLHQLGAAECTFAYRMVVVAMRRDMPLPQVLQLWEALWADAWRRRRRGGSSAGGPCGSKAASSGGGVELLANSSSSSSSSSCKDAPHGTAAGPGAAAHCSSSGGGDSSSSSGGGCDPDLFTCFVAAVIMSQRRAVLDHCYDADDVLRHFHGMKHVDLWGCLATARQLQAGQQLSAARQLQQQSVGPAPENGVCLATV